MNAIYLDKAFPDVYKAMLALNTQAEHAATSAGLQPRTIELIKVRASQLNGCAFCLRMHTRDAIAKGETADRLAVLSAWRDTSYFSEVECAALAITEEITLIADVTSGRRQKEGEHPELTSDQIAAVRWLGISINAFNRISITSHYPVGPEAQPAQHLRATPPIEFPDEAGYPDGIGLLDQGRATAKPDIVADLDEFIVGEMPNE